MADEKYSDRVLKNSSVNFVDSEMASTDDREVLPNRAIQLIYGVIAPCRLEDHRTRIGDGEIGYEELERSIEALNERIGKEYTNVVIGTERGNSENYAGLMVVGIDIHGLMTTAPGSADSLFQSRRLENAIEDRGQIIADLESIGFRDITQDDLHLHASYYQH